MQSLGDVGVDDAVCDICDISEGLTVVGVTAAKLLNSVLAKAHYDRLGAPGLS